MKRLVTIGDSLAQGLKSGAVFETDISFPAMIAWEMGLQDEDFRFPSFSGEGGLPINIEYLLRRMDDQFGKDVDWWEIPSALIHLRQWMDDIEDYWERGPGSQPLRYNGNYENLSVWRFEIQDSYNVTAGFCADAINNPSDNWISQVPEHSMLRTALRVLNPSHSIDEGDRNATQITRATELARTDDGIENLIVYLGNNNVLTSVTSLKFVESTENDLNEKDPRKRKATIYQPDHFEHLLKNLMGKVEAMNNDGGTVERVFWGTVPPVSIPPVTNGVKGRMESDMGLESPYDNDDPEWYRRYFKFYTRPWVTEQNFNRNEDPCLTGEQVIKIDKTIMEYKIRLNRLVDAHNDERERNGQSPDWFIVDIHWLLERLAFRRYIENPSIPSPPDWTPYEVPVALRGLNLNTRFLRAKQGKRVSGGYFSLDGVHPTTVGYGLVAQEFINSMQKNGVVFKRRDGQTPRTEPVQVNFDRLLKRDTLIRSLPLTLDDLWEKLVDGDQIIDIFKRAFRAFS